MYRAEFLEGLRTQLDGRMQEGKIAAHLRYYEDYIQSRVRSGESEEAVLGELGDPRLIAKTLLDADTADDFVEDPSDHYHSYDSEEEYFEGPVRSGIHELPSVVRKIAGLVVTVVVIYILFRLAILAVPFFLILILVLFIVSRLVNRDR